MPHLNLFLSIFWLLVAIPLALVCSPFSVLCFIVALGYAISYRHSVGKILKTRENILDEKGEYLLYSPHQKQILDGDKENES